MFEIVTGQNTNLVGVPELRRAVSELEPNGTLYIGYPILATADEPVVVEALLTCREFGVVAFDLKGAARRGEGLPEIEERQDDLFAALHQKLYSYKPLRSGRRLKVEPRIISLIPTDASVSIDEYEPHVLVSSPERLSKMLQTLKPISEDDLRLVNAAIQRITTIKPSNKRQTVTRADSRGAIMQKIEAEIANLDQWQKRAAIETPLGPQRVRGLAGSGKTVVLALKAAYLHAQNPTWNIVVTFHSRALRQQFEDLIRRFCFEHLNDEPDWSKLRVLHSWGSSRSPGVYYDIATEHGVAYYDFGSAKSRFGYDGAFDGACGELLADIKLKGRFRQLYDAVLIDEAQDLPQPFFELCYQVVRDPKHIVYAYDELQNIGSTAYTVPGPAVLFGKDSSGRPFVPDLSERPNEARRDIMLPVCYRNTPWALTTAHALGFGVYRDGGLVQYFDDPQLWSDVGYDVVEGELQLGHDVVMARREDSSPDYFAKLLDPEDAVCAMVFDSPAQQAEWVAEQIVLNVSEEELDLRDILVVLANPLTTREEAALVIEALNALEIPAHLAGVTASVDKLFEEDSVALSGIYRAKGNEAPMVYVLNSDYCAGGHGGEAIRRRNILFTAITRSRAWVRILGTGPGMEQLKREIEAVQEHQHKLAFRVPTSKQLERMRKIQRDASKKQAAAIKNAEKTVEELFDLVQSGRLDPATIPLDLREKMAKIAGELEE